MKAFCLLLLGLSGLILIASYSQPEYWSHAVCRNAFGLCDYPLLVALLIVGCAGLFIAVEEMG